MAWSGGNSSWGKPAGQAMRLGFGGSAEKPPVESYHAGLIGVVDVVVEAHPLVHFARRNEPIFGGIIRYLLGTKVPKDLGRVFEILLLSQPARSRLEGLNGLFNFGHRFQRHCMPAMVRASCCAMAHEKVTFAIGCGEP